MEGVKLEDLFESNRFPTGVALLPVFLYFPIGVVLAILRVFIGFNVFVVACVLPKNTFLRKFVLRVMCGVLGFVVTREGIQQLEVDKKPVRLLISNHVSVFDHLALDLIIPNYMLLSKKLDSALQWMMGFTDLGFNQRDVPFEVNVQEYCRTSSSSLLVFPEGVTTSGRRGILKFQEWPFKIGVPLQPIAIKVSRPPFAKIAVNVLGSKYVSDVFWHLFVPYTHFHIKILPVIQREEGETTEDFCRRSEKLLADALGVETTRFTSSDKAEYFKRVSFRPPRPSEVAQSGARPKTSTEESPSSSPTLITRGSLRSSWKSSSPEEDERLNVMTQQVKEVLTQVPIHVIRKDLSTTRDVDMTITNLLEGTISYTPEDSDEGSSKSSPHTQPKQEVAISPGRIAAKSFAKSSKDRQLSFEERKKRLIETARERYMLKHGLLGSS